jgi:hypothetical protein
MLHYCMILPRSLSLYFGDTEYNVDPHLTRFFIHLVCITSLQEIEKYYFRVVPSGTTYVPNLIQIHSAVLELNYTDRLT